MAEERNAVKRVVLMEFEVGKEILAADEGVAEALNEQLGGTVPDNLRVLVQVAEAEGGPKQVVDEVAKTGGRFRAIARESFDQGSETVPPEQQKFVLRPL